MDSDLMFLYMRYDSPNIGDCDIDGSSEVGRLIFAVD